MGHSAQMLKAVVGLVALVTAVLLALLIIVIAYLRLFTPHRCFLDILNARIEAQSEFRPFYAGVPGLPATREAIPELGDLEDAFPAVRAEALAALARSEGRVPQMRDVYNHMLSKGEGDSRGVLARGLTRLVYGTDTDTFDKIGTPKWKTFNLFLFNQDVPGNAEQCPTIVSLLKRVPGVQSALVSVMEPGAYVPPHSDPAKGVVRYHLGIKVPKDRANCWICVDGQKYCWEEGKGVLFDDVFDHWVRNDTDETRVILFVDILRPLTGTAKVLQSLANWANRYHPGVRKAVARSSVASR
jgi:hypothetical protein